MDQSTGRLHPSSAVHNLHRPHVYQLQHADLVELLSHHWQFARHNGVLFIRTDRLANSPVSAKRRRE